MDRSIRTRAIDATQCIFFTEFGFREESSPLDGGDYCDFDNIANASVLSNFLGVGHSEISFLKSLVVNPNNSAINDSVSFVRMTGGYFDEECQDGSSIGANVEFVALLDFGI